MEISISKFPMNVKVPIITPTVTRGGEKGRLNIPTYLEEKLNNP